MFIYCHPGMDMHGVIALNVLPFQIQFPLDIKHIWMFQFYVFPPPGWIIQHPKLISGCNISHRILSEEWGDTCGLQIRKGGSEIVGYRRPGRWGSLFKSGVNWAMKTSCSMVDFIYWATVFLFHRHIFLVFTKSSCCFCKHYDLGPLWYSASLSSNK